MSDERLRERFEKLRREEAADTPGFDAVRARAASGPAQRGFGAWPVAAAAAVVLLALVWSNVPGDPPTPRMTPFEPGRWAMPTDVLLEMPGSELLRELPEIGTPAPDPNAPDSPRRILG
jgi:hypothetical protein